MTEKEVRALVIKTLQQCGFPVPVEETFDYSEFSQIDKTKKFVRLCNGDWRNAIYVRKQGSRDDDCQYFDLLYVVDEAGDPVCIPVPLARKLFGSQISMTACKDFIAGNTYEYMYKAHYDGHMAF